MKCLSGPRGCHWLLIVLCHAFTAIGSNTTSDPTNSGSNGSAACRYKVWYLEACIEDEHSQTVHLILSKGGISCDIVKHLTKVCIPSDANARPITPEKAMFKELLSSEKNITPTAIQKFLSGMSSDDLPDVFKPEHLESSERAQAENVLVEEVKDFHTSQALSSAKGTTPFPEESLNSLKQELEDLSKTGSTPKDAAETHGDGDMMMTELLNEINSVGSLQDLELNESGNSTQVAGGTTVSSFNRTQGDNPDNVTHGDEMDESGFVDRLMGIFKGSTNTTSEPTQLLPVANQDTSSPLPDELFGDAFDQELTINPPDLAINSSSLGDEKSEDQEGSTTKSMMDSLFGSPSSHSTESGENKTSTPVMDQDLMELAAGSHDSLVRSGSSNGRGSSSVEPLNFVKNALSLDIDAQPGQSRPSSSLLEILSKHRKELKSLEKGEKMKTVLEQIGMAYPNRSQPGPDDDVIVADTNEATSIKGFFQDLPKADNGSRVINWMIQNMPNGKQTIVIL